MASPEERESMRKITEEQVMAKRRAQGLDYQTKLDRFNKKPKSDSTYGAFPAFNEESSNVNTLDPASDLAGPSPAAAGIAFPANAAAVPAPTINTTDASMDPDEDSMNFHQMPRMFGQPYNSSYGGIGHDFGMPMPSFEGNNSQRLPFLQSSSRGLQAGGFECHDFGTPSQRLDLNSGQDTRADIAALQADLKSTRDQVNKLENQVETLTAQLDDARSNYAELEARIESIKQNVSNYELADRVQRVSVGVQAIMDMANEATARLTNQPRDAQPAEDTEHAEHAGPEQEGREPELGDDEDNYMNYFNFEN
ncbi:hypothetical protein GGR54DRAFT_294459 [Hypoxylon sp. NC1633]|nr:hypothetical protein GGR54DRAFT_294459 [Hypoxylon sp. NC1633]